MGKKWLFTATSYGLPSERQDLGQKNFLSTKGAFGFLPNPVTNTDPAKDMPTGRDTGVLEGF